MRLKLLILCCLWLFAACNTAEKPTPEPSPSADTSASPSPETTLQPPESDQYLISETGIGEAQLGMTMGELKAQVGDRFEFEPEQAFMVGLNAIPVTQNDEVQYYILHWGGVPFDDSSPIEIVVTDNPAYRTAEGIGAKTPIRQAETVYGEATVSYNLENESREYINFADSPLDNITFRGNDELGDFVGIYADEETTSYQETTELKEGAEINSIRVIERPME